MCVTIIHVYTCINGEFGKTNERQNRLWRRYLVKRVWSKKTPKARMFQTQHVLGLDFARPNKTISNYRFMKFFWWFDVKNREHHQSKLQGPFPAIIKWICLFFTHFRNRNRHKSVRQLVVKRLQTVIYTRLTSRI